MSTIVEATVPAEQFALPDALTALPDVEFRAVRLVASEPGRVVPFLWATRDDLSGLVDAIRDDPSVASADVFAEYDAECLLRIDWRSHARVLTSVLREEGAMILDVHGFDGEWHLQVLFPDHDSVSTTETFFGDFGIETAIESVEKLSETTKYGDLGLPERQFETIVCAYECGYYDVPRRVTQEELAERFDISHQALSERLRRAHETVVSNALYHTIHRRDHSVSPHVRSEVDT